MDKKIVGRVAHGDSFYSAGQEDALEKVLSPNTAEYLKSVHAIEGDWNATAPEAPTGDASAGTSKAKK